MCVVHMRVQCSKRFPKVLVDDVECTELTIESIVGTALLEVSDAVVIENVTDPSQRMKSVSNRVRNTRR